MLRLVQKLSFTLTKSLQCAALTKNLQVVRCFAKEDQYDKSMIKKFRFLQSNRHPDIEVFKRQLLYRASRMGQKELELLVHKYLKNFMGKMTYDELVKFEEEVLLTDNMVLFNHILGSKPMTNLPADSYITKIKEFALSDKGDKSFI